VAINAALPTALVHAKSWRPDPEPTDSPPSGRRCLAAALLSNPGRPAKFHLTTRTGHSFDC
jgi:hypothetical protein